MPITIRGIQEAQRANLRIIAAVKPSGKLGQAVRNVTILAHRGSVARTHVITGTLRASHRMDLSNARGVVFIDPSAVNPVSHIRAEKYGPVEHARGGSHAFYGRTVYEDGPMFARTAGSTVIAGLR